MSPADFGLYNSPVGTNGYIFFTRFLVSPSYDQLQLSTGSLFGLTAYEPDPSFDFFALSMLQVGGAKVAFSTNRDGRVQIYLMNADGSGQAQLVSSGGNDDNPRFSPNGVQILFQSDRDDPVNGYNDIYVMNSDGSGQTRLTIAAGDDCAPSWSPNGSKVVFQSLRDGQQYQVYSMNADGSGQVNLGNSAGNDRQPSWSPNGAKIAFASDRDHAGYASVYVMNANGTGQQRLTFSADDVTDEQPVWSRDSSKITFVSTRDGDKEIYVMNADGTGQTRLTSAQGNDDSPFWSPDGSKIIFRSDRFRDSYDPTSQVWVMNSDGTGQTNLSGNEFGDYTPSWTSGGGNQPPVANVGGSYSGVTGQNTAFIGANSFDPDGSITNYSWSFGDGGTATGSSPTHAYASSGIYTVTLTVTDNLGAQASAKAAVNVSSSSSDGFVQNFLQWGLARQPSGQEGSYWSDILCAAYPKGQGSMLLAMREFGMTVFESSEYAARNRSNHWYVYDLYKTYLMRDPDASGWAWWESKLPSMGREQLRHAFDESTEFGNIVATLTASGPPSAAVSSLATARVDPFNQTGDQLRARDCEWSLTLLSLPGRAGLDLGLGLSYSSLVWTRSGPYAYFDEDAGSPSPGFRLGFATIQGPYFDARVAKNIYVLVTSSDSRVELRQVGTSNTYEAGDSSYLQLTAGGGILLLRSTDGTQVSYSNSVNGWRATAIEDRNGNFLSVNYDWRGDITSVTDTLGRVINFNYDANANISAITQSWVVNGVAQTHTWASFGWGTQALQPGFASLGAVGTFGGEIIPVLTQVGLDDGSRYNFEYTTAGQVNVISRHTSDNVERSRTAYDYATPADDCPRVISARVQADNWTGVNGVPAEVVTQFTVDGDGSHSMTAPDGTVYRESYGTGWQKGLVTQEEVESGGAQQRLTITTWDQDNTALNYQTNPRVKEINIYDFPIDAPSNRRRTTIDYGQYVQYGLPYLITEYDSDGVHELRRSYTDYNMAQAHLDRRIIGLVSAVHVYDPVAGQWQTKTTYSYDETGSVQPQATTATGHDQSYNSSFLTRGNVTSVSRWDVTDIGNASKAHTTRITYDAAGSILSTTDPLNHQSSIAYADSFSDDNNSRNTFAYPTTLTDAGGFSSSIQYNYDFGARTRVQGPPPAGQTSGIVQTVAYDGAARVERMTTTNNGAYTRYAYGPNYVATFSSVNTVADEAYMNTVFDGMGRTILVGSNNPNGGGPYKAQVVQYDLMGRAVKRSNPSDVNSTWSPVGPDDRAGWLYTQQTYDWKGRPRVTTNTDGTQRSASYEGCGCAGGEVVTLTDEMGRRQKVYSDSLGRQWKTETLNWDGSVYSTATNILNALDRVSFARRYQGNEQSGVYQESVMTYDGYGRLKIRKAPAESSAAEYEYNADDTLYRVKDARGVYATYSYNDNRHLLTGVAYTVPSGVSPSIDPASPVGFEYDAAGNRTLMTDGLGKVEYGYDALSRMKWEKRTFAPLNNAAYTINYDYNLAGGLKFVTDPFGAKVNYGYDASGRLSEVTGESAFAGVTQYATGIQYRAWGDVKHVGYGDGKASDALYNTRMQMSHFTVAGLIDNNFTYDPDGRARSLRGLDPVFDRDYRYDHAGRMVEGLSGTEARGGTTADGPYRHTYQYDEFNHLTGRTTRFWSQPADSFTMPFVNDRSQDPAMHYDAAGNVTQTENQSFTMDAAGRTTYVRDINADLGTIRHTYDGGGLIEKRVENRVINVNGSQGYYANTTYYVRSTVLSGRVLTELTYDGQKDKTNVYAGGALIAKQRNSTFYYGNTEVVWEHGDPVTGTTFRVASGGALRDHDEFDPTGANVGASDPFLQFVNPTFSDINGGDPLYTNGGNPLDKKSGCAVDGRPILCDLAAEWARWGALTGNKAGDAWEQMFRTDGEPGVAGVLTVESPLYFGGTYRFVKDLYDYGTWFGDRYFNAYSFYPQRRKRKQGVVAPQSSEVQLIPPSKPITDLINDLLKKGDCAKYVQQLLDKANELFAGKYPHVNTISEAMEKISQAGGYQLDSHGIHTVSGDLFYKGGGAQPGTVHIIPFRSYGAPSASAVAHAQYYYAISGLHESFHLARQGGYDDELMAQAAYALAKKKLASPPPGLDSFGRAAFFSSTWDAELMAHCKE